MKILFIHPNFPAQFKFIAAAFASEGHHVRFLCQTHYGRTLKDVERITIKSDKRKKEESMHKKNGQLTEAFAKADAYRDAVFKQLRNSGWNPDIVIAHSGWGAGIYLKLVFFYSIYCVCRMVV